MDLVSLAYQLKDGKEAFKANEDDYEFIGKCISHFNKTKSQNFQDVFAHHVNPAGGWYVEFGACDGKDEGSNTWMLSQEYDWQGILAEPNPIWHDHLKHNRPFDRICYDCVWTKTGETIQFNVTDEAQLSTIAGYGDDEHSEKRKNGKLIDVKTISLFDLMETYGSRGLWNYLSIDTEGSEYDILNQFFQDNDGRYAFRCVTVEHNYQEEYRKKIYDLMTSQGYIRKYTYISRWDDFYVLKG